MLFPNRSWGPFLEIPSAELLQKKKLVPFSIFWIFKKAPFGHHVRAAGRHKPSPANYGWRPGADPASHETIVITVPLGLKDHFFDGEWLIYSFSYFSLCYVLYNIFITFFHNTTVNAKPLSRPIFAPHFKIDHMIFANTSPSGRVGGMVGEDPQPRMARANIRSMLPTSHP